MTEPLSGRNTIARTLFLFAVAMVVILGPSNPGFAAEPLKEYTNCQLIDEPWADGDSFHVQFSEDVDGGRDHVVRLYYVDCPESVARLDSDVDRLREQTRYFGVKDLMQTLSIGKKAKKFVKSALSDPFTVWTRFANARGRAAKPRIYGIVILANKKPLDEFGLGIPSYLVPVCRPHLGPAIYTDRSLIGLRALNRSAAFRTAFSTTTHNKLPFALEMELCPFLADNPYLRTDWPGQMEFVGKELFHALIVQIKAGTAGQGFFCFPYPFLYEMTWALNQDSFTWFGNKMSYRKSHEGLAAPHFANQKSSLMIFFVKRPSHRQNSSPGL
jgi:endonuclease YncB( thermonuclease family)